MVAPGHVACVGCDGAASRRWLEEQEDDDEEMAPGHVACVGCDNAPLRCWLVDDDDEKEEEDDEERWSPAMSLVFGVTMLR